MIKKALPIVIIINQSFQFFRGALISHSTLNINNDTPTIFYSPNNCNLDKSDTGINLTCPNPDYNTRPVRFNNFSRLDPDQSLALY